MIMMRYIQKQNNQEKKQYMDVRYMDVINSLYDKFKVFSDDYLFIKNKFITIHNKLNHTNISDDFLLFNK